MNSANIGLKGGAGVCGAIHDAAGPELDEECARIGSCQCGEAIIAKGYNLPAKYIIHTVAPIYGQHHDKKWKYFSVATTNRYDWLKLTR